MRLLASADTIKSLLEIQKEDMIVLDLVGQRVLRVALAVPPHRLAIDLITIPETRGRVVGRAPGVQRRVELVIEETNVVLNRAGSHKPRLVFLQYRVDEGFQLTPDDISYYPVAGIARSYRAHVSWQESTILREEKQQDIVEIVR